MKHCPFGPFGKKKKLGFAGFRLFGFSARYKNFKKVKNNKVQ